MKKIVCILFACILSLGMISVFSGCDGDSDYDQIGTLKRAEEKSKTGAPLTKQEERELESFKEWEKEYDAQQYNEKYYGY